MMRCRIAGLLLCALAVTVSSPNVFAEQQETMGQYLKRRYQQDVKTFEAQETEEKKLEKSERAQERAQVQKQWMQQQTTTEAVPARRGLNPWESYTAVPDWKNSGAKKSKVQNTQTTEQSPHQNPWAGQNNPWLSNTNESKPASSEQSSKNTDQTLPNIFH